MKIWDEKKLGFELWCNKIKGCRLADKRWIISVIIHCLSIFFCRLLEQFVTYLFLCFKQTEIKM